MNKFVKYLFSLYPPKEISYNSKMFPQKLKQLNDCPNKIYVIGDETILNDSLISIVGTRKASPYGNKLSHDFSSELTKYDFIVVSGMAFGIDRSAHEGATINGKTIAVIAGGFEQTINSNNYTIAKLILDHGGTIISEYDSTLPPKAFTFLRRNRLIAAISIATIIIEAPFKSGAINTASHCIKLGKPLYCVPWALNYSKGFGSNSLLKENALPLIDIHTIIKKYSNNQIDFLNKQLNQINIPNNLLPYYDCIKENGPINDELIYDYFSDKSTAEISACLSLLEINSYIKYQDGKYYI